MDNDNSKEEVKDSVEDKIAFTVVYAENLDRKEDIEEFKNYINRKIRE